MNSRTKILLGNIYHDPENPAGYKTVDALWRATNKSVPKPKVEKYLQTQNAFTLHRNLRKRFQRNVYLVDNIDDLWQADLNDMSSLKQYNDGFIYLLTVIDVFSKVAWAVPLKRKTGEAVTEAFKLIFKESKRKPVSLNTDKGREFINKVFQKFLKDKDVNYYHTNNPDIKASVVERFNRTLKSRMYRYFTAKSTQRYVDVLPQLIKAYNHTVHRSIRMAPVDVKDDNVLQVWHNLYDAHLSKKNATPKFSIGEHVRISSEKFQFEKGYVQNWSEEVFLITHILRHKLTVYRIKDLDDEEIEGTFYEKELQKVIIDEATEYRIDKIVDTKGVGVRKKLLVKWKGYSNKFNSWISASELKQYG